jgi:dephospho-CoA kinase
MRAPVIGLIGGIGSGKSTVADVWSELGCEVSHSDELVRLALEDPYVKARLIGWWGPRILAADGGIDRKAVAGIVFSDPTERLRLESITHPWIEERRRAAFADASAATAYVIDAPLLLEAGLERGCDAVVFIDASQAVREARVAASRGWGPEELARREAAQLPLDQKRARADHVLHNEGDLASLRSEARRLLERMLATHTARQRGDTSAPAPRNG